LLEKCSTQQVRANSEQEVSGFKGGDFQTDAEIVVFMKGAILGLIALLLIRNIQKISFNIYNDT